MRKYEWSEYYENFYFMDERCQVKDVFKLKSLGPSDEVYKIISELSKHKKAANSCSIWLWSKDLFFKRPAGRHY